MVPYLNKLWSQVYGTIDIYPVRQSFTVDIERHRKLEFRAGVLQHSGIILDQHILWFGPSIDLDFPSYGFQLLQLKSVLLL